MRPREFFKVQCTVLQPQSKVVKGHNNINCMLEEGYARYSDYLPRGNI